MKLGSFWGERERGIERERIGVIPFGYVYGLMGVGLV